MPIETKLRDVIAGAFADRMPDASPDDEEVTNTIIRRLGSAESIELDDGTLFVRRATPRSLTQDFAQVLKDIKDIKPFEQRQQLLNSFGTAVSNRNSTWVELEQTIRGEYSDKDVQKARANYEQALEVYSQLADTLLEAMR